MSFARNVFLKFLVGSLLTILVQTASAATDFSLPWLNGRQSTFSTASYPSGVFLVEFFQTRCGYCAENVPVIKRLNASYQGTRVQVVSVGMDPAGPNYARWIARHNIEYPVLGDYNRALARQFNITGTPTTLVLDCKLREKWRHSGALSSASEATLRSVVAEVAAQPCTH